MRNKIISLILCAAVLFNLLPSKLCAEKIIITRNPQDVNVAYPHGTSFSVEVNDPESIASYQWIAVDNNGKEYVLDGSSAAKPTLKIPATTPDFNGYSYYCILKDQQGHEYLSDKAVLTIRNYLVKRTVLYICDQAIEAGQYLNLADTDLGSGIISFSDNGFDINFHNVQIDNSLLTYDHHLAPARGISLISQNITDYDFFFNISGTCSINNTYIDEEGRNGITISTDFGEGDHQVKPVLSINGNGRLIINGGDAFIETSGDLYIYCNIDGNANEGVVTEGFRCQELVIDNEASVNLKTSGNAIRSEGDVFIADSSLYIENKLSPFEEGPAMNNAILLYENFYLEHAYVEINTIISTEDFVPYDNYVAYYNGIAILKKGIMEVSGSYMKIDISSDEGEKPFAMNINGIYLNNNESFIQFQSGSDVLINIDTPQTENVSGIENAGMTYVIEESSLNISLSGDGQVYGIHQGSYFYGEDCQIDVNIRSKSQSDIFGIVATSFLFETENSTFHLKADAENGVAMAALVGSRLDRPRPFDDSYVSQAIHTTGELEFFLPRKYTINSYSQKKGSYYNCYETIYDQSNTDKPASTVQIEVAERIDSSYLLITNSLSLLAAVIILIRFFWRGNKK